MCFLLTFPTGHLGCEELTHLKRPWCCEGLKAGGEEDNRGWDGWMASLTQWAWVWVNSGSWWWTGRTGMLQSMGSQRVRHNWVTERNWTDLKSMAVQGCEFHKNKTHVCLVYCFSSVSSIVLDNIAVLQELLLSDQMHAWILSADNTWSGLRSSPCKHVMKG